MDDGNVAELHATASDKYENAKRQLLLAGDDERTEARAEF